ncbi:MAG: AAA family ATPase [Candidatus Desulfofervidus auxilii]|nr:AAA family ATPase [Candidatus Desulfofervidus auxilii]
MLDLKTEFERRGLYYPDNVVSILNSSLQLRSGIRAFMLRGPAGVGKTAMTYALSDILNAEYVFYQCTLGTSEDDLLYKLLPSERTKSGIEKIPGPLIEALLKSRKKLTVLVLDEFDKTRPSCDALLLDFLQNCRVSARFSNQDRIIVGNKNNLIVFLTSNDERDFSEPLLRRVIQIFIPHLSVKLVRELLSKKFKDERVVNLLTQIYIDTINAQLRKPATIQELYQLGEVIENLNSDNFDLASLVRSFIVKYDDDWIKYVQYVNSREPYQFIKEEVPEENGNINKKYEGEGEIVIEEKEEEKETFDLNKVSRIHIKKIESSFEVEEAREEREVCMKVEDENKEAYTHIIKEFKPEPTDRPDQFGDYKMYFDENKVFVVKDKPLTLDELSRIYLTGEFYSEDRGVLTTVDLNALINSSIRVLYYTKNCIRLKFEHSRDGYSIIELNLKERKRGKYVSIYDVFVRMYVNGKAKAFAEKVKVIKEELYLKRLIKDVSTDYPKRSQILRYLDYVRELKHTFNVNVYFSLYGSYNFKTEISSDSVGFCFGYNFKSNIMKKFGLEEGARIDIDDPIVDKVVNYVVSELVRE